MPTDPVLVLVDLQKGFCDPSLNPKLARDDEAAGRLRDVIGNVVAHLNRYRASGRTPVFVRTHHAPDGRRGSGDDRPENAPPPCLPGTRPAEFVDELDVRDDDAVVTKQGYDPFYDTTFQALLDDADVSRVHVVGAFTDVCVTAAVLGLTSRQYDVTVLSDCVAASSVERHENAIDTLSIVADGLRPSGEIELD